MAYSLNNANRCALWMNVAFANYSPPAGFTAHHGAGWAPGVDYINTNSGPNGPGWESWLKVTGICTTE
eukprot:UN07229